MRPHARTLRGTAALGVGLVCLGLLSHCGPSEPRALHIVVALGMTPDEIERASPSHDDIVDKVADSSLGDFLATLDYAHYARTTTRPIDVFAIRGPKGVADLVVQDAHADIDIWKGRVNRLRVRKFTLDDGDRPFPRFVAALDASGFRGPEGELASTVIANVFAEDAENVRRYEWRRQDASTCRQVYVLRHDGALFLTITIPTIPDDPGRAFEEAPLPSLRFELVKSPPVFPHEKEWEEFRKRFPER